MLHHASIWAQAHPFAKARWCYLHEEMWPVLLILILMTVLSTYSFQLQSLHWSALSSSRRQNIEDHLVCAPHGAVGCRAALATPISEAFLPAAGPVHMSTGAEGCSEGCEAAHREERQGKMMGARPDGKTPLARAEHLLLPAAAPALLQAGPQPLGVLCRATGWRRHSAPFPHRSFLIVKAFPCQHPTLAWKSDQLCASSHDHGCCAPLQPPPKKWSGTAATHGNA